MNLLLLEPGELSPEGTARIGGLRAEQVRAVRRVDAAVPYAIAQVEWWIRSRS